MNNMNPTFVAWCILMGIAGHILYGTRGAEIGVAGVIVIAIIIIPIFKSIGEWRRQRRNRW